MFDLNRSLLDMLNIITNTIEKPSKIKLLIAVVVKSRLNIKYELKKFAIAPKNKIGDANITDIIFSYFRIVISSLDSFIFLITSNIV